jgi:hypothetical protein
MWAVADYIAVNTQNCPRQLNRIYRQNPLYTYLGGRTWHGALHRTSVLRFLEPMVPSSRD